MNSKLDKSLSDTEINKTTTTSSPNFVFQRAKRPRGKEDSLTYQLGDFKEDIKKMISDFTNKYGVDLLEFKTTLKDIQKTNQTICESISYLTAQNDELNKRINVLENDAKEDKKYILILESKIEDMQVTSRKSNFEIKNVPIKNNENKEDLIEMVMSLSKNIGCEVMKNDIKDIYRAKGKKQEKKNTSIIVETNSTLVKTEILSKSKHFNRQQKTKLCCKHLGFKTQEDNPVYVSEHLTTKGSRLYYLARDLAKSNAYKYCWTAYGRVHVRKDDRSPVITIRSEEQIHHLLLQK